MWELVEGEAQGQILEVVLSKASVYTEVLHLTTGTAENHCQVPA